MKLKRLFYVIVTLAWTSLAASSWADPVTISDPNLSAAILDALRKQAGPLTSPRRAEDGGFEFTLTGPPGVYTVFDSEDLKTWNEAGSTTNTVGNVTFTDETTPALSQKFYHAALIPE